MIEDVNYYALGATWDDIDKTKDFVEQGIWENGWDDGSNENIIKQIKVGDYIVLKSSYTRMKNLPFDNHNKSVSVMKIKAIGRVVENPQDGKILKIKYEDDFKPREIFGFTYRRTVSIINKEKWPEEIEWIFFNKPQSHYYSFSQKNIGVESFNIKNIILYGAPGVGKTHNYKNLIAMIEEGKNQKEIFDTIAENGHVELENETFEIIKQEKRVEFVTFHQSYSYEDFIEGFRPNESGSIELEDGIFKRHALNALNKIKESEFKHISFDEAYDILRTSYMNEELETLKTVTNVEIIINDFREKSLSVQTVNAKDSQYVKKHDLETVVNAMLKNLVNKPSDIRLLEVKKDTFSLSGYYFPIGNKIVEIIKNNKIDVEKEKNFYIVIDEINRGNISKIFGELITLIEEDKRDVYEVTLPYSKEKFKVPSNLYIIATMNSTDKSIATIDIALRRRFTFLKMKPNEELVTFPHAKILLNKLNSFIEENLGEDYKLGHSYFMNIINNEDLEFVKRYKIQPLLEEYFYVDKNKLNEALNILKREENNE